MSSRARKPPRAERTPRGGPPGRRCGTSETPRRLVVVLIRPSRYDDDGYVVRHWRGTLPSNTLSCLHSLTEDAVGSGVFGPVKVRVEVIDEIVSRVNPAALGRRFKRDGTKVVVGLVGGSVQAAADSIAGCPATKYFGVAGEDFNQSRYATDAAAASDFRRAPRLPTGWPLYRSASARPSSK